MPEDLFTSKLASLSNMPVSEIDDATPIVPKEWDSVDVLDLIAAIDETYGTTVPVQELNRCETVGQLRALIASAAAK